jgi:hypothetical protein
LVSYLTCGGSRFLFVSFNARFVPYHVLISFFLRCLESVLVEARNDCALQDKEETAAAVQTTKDDIVRLLHLFKEPRAQRHWTNLYSVLSRPELDARKSGREYSESANPLEFLAEIFNDYDTFQPQNLMVEYVNSTTHSRPEKRCPYAASSSEWAYLSAFAHELEPTNISRRNIIRGGDWIKSTWGEVRRYLHQVRMITIVFCFIYHTFLTIFSFVL